MAQRSLVTLVSSLANRETPRTEAMVQADVRELLLTAPLGLGPGHVVLLEAPAGGHRRIDVEVGYTVIEVKKDLRVGNVLQEAEAQLAGYVRARTETLGQRYVGVLTDGCEWRAYQMMPKNQLLEVSSTRVISSDSAVDELLVWLEGVLATTQGLTPTPAEVARRLGHQSSAHALDQASLVALYSEHRDLPSVQLKRELWAKLLTTALGTQFEDIDDLFLEHTLLVNTAEIIAHATLGLNVEVLEPATLLTGHRFEQRGIFGVVESDFFNWVIDVPGGVAFVRALARRLGRFDWESVDHDVLKVLYESIIGSDTRRRLGEYYTPDWLAEHMVSKVVTDQLNDRVLDPACGSGTFLFYAVRQFLASAFQAGLPLREALTRVTEQVMGVDLHPVAVALARVTYLLAIGTDRLKDPARGPISVPVYLGDSVQWQQRLDLYTADSLVIHTQDDAEFFASELRFPDRLLADAGRFNRLVADLADLAAKPRPPGSTPPLAAVFRRLGIDSEDEGVISDTFAVLCRLHDEGRDHIWGYYIRNLARPLWLSRDENRVDVIVGNPPWLAYRHMPQSMQQTFREMSVTRGMWHGMSVATHQDLSALFVARAVQLYLRTGGRFAFVMPSAALDRGQYKGFRTGRFADPFEPASVAFSQSWDLRRLRPHFFPRASAVVFGHRTTDREARPLPRAAEIWSGRIPRMANEWSDVSTAVERRPGDLVVSDDAGGVDTKAVLSPYARRFAQGASIVPRVLFFVEDQPASPLGLPVELRAVRSTRSALERPPWKNLPPLEGVVEAEFVRAVYLSEGLLPHRLLPARNAVIPLEGTGLLGGESDRIDLYPGLATWWRQAESSWLSHRSSDRLTLIDQLNFRNKLLDQFPTTHNRVVYSKSGMHLTAARLEDPTAVIDHTLYWGAVGGLEEAVYLCSILNSPRTTSLVRPLMSYGKDERHIDKHVWLLPIPKYEPGNPVHAELVRCGLAAEKLAATLKIDKALYFSASRRRVRQALAVSAVGVQIDALVDHLLQ